jgi:hypothetical protein
VKTLKLAFGGLIVKEWGRLAALAWLAESLRMNETSEKSRLFYQGGVI